ncbi:hypothetical protein NQ317_011713 [Molorchus minor]|uniref:RNase H type-1 domain-containing protein n=1 Tax=Molorchus minor TaxID=1323400 RepID=A0ABQ9J3G5_9CUCU|nr:hypothetical protein NQ317_011713 [Molorchus minor]
MFTKVSNYDQQPKTAVFSVEVPSREEWASNKTDLVHSKGSGSLMGQRPMAVQEQESMGHHRNLCYLCLCAENLRRGAQDSQAALKALDSNKISSKLVWDCHINLQRLATNNRVKLRWIPGRSGLEGNERADLLARLGSELGPVGPEPLVAISKATCAQSISKWVIQQHVEYWEKQEHRQSRMFMAEPTDQLTNSLLNINRKQTRTIIGVLTGHCPHRGTYTKWDSQTTPPADAVVRTKNQPSTYFAFTARAWLAAGFDI